MEASCRRRDLSENRQWVIRGLEEPAWQGVGGGAQSPGVMIRPGHTAQVSVEALEQVTFCPSGTTGSQGRYKTKPCPVAWKIPPATLQLRNQRLLSELCSKVLLKGNKKRRKKTDCTGSQISPGALVEPGVSLPGSVFIFQFLSEEAGEKGLFLKLDKLPTFEALAQIHGLFPLCHLCGPTFCPSWSMFHK